MVKNQSRQCFFAASNSARGFCNYFDDIFSPTHVDHLYIIKGGPGTGKSYFMRTVADRATAAGYTVTEYACSSDPSSLDGLLLRRSGLPAIGLVDGTAPHVAEANMPGIREELIDLGAFWDAGVLHRERDAILRHTAEKASAYADAYAHLRAAGEMRAVADRLLDAAIRPDRLRALVLRLLRGLPDEAGKAGAKTEITTKITTDPSTQTPCATTDLPRSWYYRTGDNASLNCQIEPKDDFMHANGHDGDEPTAVMPPMSPIALRRAVGMTGRVTLPVYERMADTVVVIGDGRTPADRLLAARVLGRLHDLSLAGCRVRGKGQKNPSQTSMTGNEEMEWASMRDTSAGEMRAIIGGHLVSRDPIYADTVDGLFYPTAQRGMAVLAGGTVSLGGAAFGREDDGDGCEDTTAMSHVERVRTVSLRRCLDTEALRRIRPELRRVDGLGEAHEEEAVMALARAREAHFALEHIYTAAMDLTAKEAFCDRFCRHLFG